VKSFNTEKQNWNWNYTNTGTTKFFTLHYIIANMETEMIMKLEIYCIGWCKTALPPQWDPRSEAINLVAMVTKIWVSYMNAKWFALEVAEMLAFDQRFSEWVEFKKSVFMVLAWLRKYSHFFVTFWHTLWMSMCSLHRNIYQLNGNDLLIFVTLSLCRAELGQGLFCRLHIYDMNVSLGSAGPLGALC